MDITSKRILIVAAAWYTGALLLIARLLYLDVYLGEQLLLQSTKNFTRIQKISSVRGNIVDTHWHPLATTIPAPALFWQGTGNRTLSSEQRTILEHVTQLLGANLSLNTLHEQITQAERTHGSYALAYGLSTEQLSIIAEQFAQHPNLKIRTLTKRFYPYGSLASHVIGYLGNFETQYIGKMGLERIFEQALRGVSGAVRTTVNAQGMRLAQDELEQSHAGKTIRTTIDLRLQRLAERLFPRDYAGACIIMDPANGALRALVSRPAFNPSLFLGPISHDQWEALQKEQPFLNRALNACYPPGSIFKLITLSAALEKGLLAPDSEWECTGHILFGKRKHHCNKLDGHGIVNTRQALAHSCNTPFFTVAQDLPMDTLSDYAHRFGLGRATGILLQEQSGLVPTVQWKRETKGEVWWPGETLSAAIGQSYLLATPIQIARVISGIVQGYLVRPRILEEESVDSTPLALKAETLDFLRQSMKMVVATGTGKQLSTVADMTVYAKTSTAQTSSLNKRHLGGKHREHIWFAGAFQYQQNPMLTIVIVLEHTGAGKAANMFAKQLLMGYKELYDNHTTTSH